MNNHRWYCLSHDGLLNLCADKADAVRTAKDADMLWPPSAPHRAVQLVEYDGPEMSRLREMEKVLRQIADMPRRTREQRLASACLRLLDCLEKDGEA